MNKVLLNMNRCGAETNEGLPCKQKVREAGLKCYNHDGRKKAIRKAKIKDKFCPKCGTKEEWKSIASYGFSKYEVSTIGRVLNIQTGKFLNGTPRDGYTRVYLTNDDDNQKPKCVHTLQGIVCVKIEKL